MLLQLSVLVRDDQSLAGIEDCRRINVYQLEGDYWSAVHSFQWQLGELSGMGHIRKGIQGLIGQLGDCRIIIGRKIAGLPYHVFDKEGFHIFETDKPISAELLSFVQKEFDQAAAEQEMQASFLQKIHKAPYSPNNDGIYYLDLTILQQAFPEISSKKALRQFLEESHFAELHLLCSHMPPWLADAARSRGMHTCLSNQDNGTCKMTIRKEPKHDE